MLTFLFVCLRLLWIVPQCVSLSASAAQTQVGGRLGVARGFAGC